MIDQTPPRRRLISIALVAALASVSFVAFAPEQPASADTGGVECRLERVRGLTVSGSTVTIPSQTDEYRYYTYVLRGQTKSDRYGDVVFTGVPEGVHRIEVTEHFLQDGRDIGIGQEFEASVTVGDSRLAGANRFATAAAIDAEFNRSCQFVYLASGLNFPDALASVPVAQRLLLTLPDRVPDETLARLEANPPSRIVLTGGPTTISTAVEQQLVGLGYNVDRIAGSDRYDTALRIAEDAVFEWYWDADELVELPATGAYIVTGERFPDAVSAGAAGAMRGVPVILVPGSGSSLPAGMLSRIDALVDGPVTIVGDANAVSQGIAQSLTNAGFTVNRIAGANRYDTNASVMLSLDLDRPAAALVATGFRFPDALAGGVLAGALPGPVLLAPTSCLLPSASSALTAMGDPQIIALGDQTSVVDGIRDRDC